MTDKRSIHIVHANRLKIYYPFTIVQKRESSSKPVENQNSKRRNSFRPSIPPRSPRDHIDTSSSFDWDLEIPCNHALRRQEQDEEPRLHRQRPEQPAGMPHLQQGAPGPAAITTPSSPEPPPASPLSSPPSSSASSFGKLEGTGDTSPQPQRGDVQEGHAGGAEQRDPDANRHSQNPVSFTKRTSPFPIRCEYL